MNPLLQAFVKLVGVEPRENATEGVVRRDSVFEFEKATKPFFFGECEAFEVGPGIDSTDGSSEGDHDHVRKLVIDLLELPGIGQRAKDCKNAR